MAESKKTVFTISPSIEKILKACDSGQLDALAPEMGEHAVAIWKKWWNRGKLTAVRFTGDIWGPCDENNIITQSLKADITAENNLLDIACGIGGPARVLAKHFRCHVTGMDIDAEAIEVARALTRLEGLTDLLSFKVGDRSHLPFEEGIFDLVWGHGGWGPGDEPWREAARILKKGGKIITIANMSKMQLLVELGFSEMRFYSYYRLERLENVRKFLRAMEEHRDEIIARTGEANFKDWYEPKKMELADLVSSSYPYGVILGIK